MRRQSSDDERFLLPTREGLWFYQASVSVLLRDLFYVIDDHHLDSGFLRLELQPKLFLKIGEDGRLYGISGCVRFFDIAWSETCRQVEQVDVEGILARQPSFVENWTRKRRQIGEQPGQRIDRVIFVNRAPRGAVVGNAELAAVALLEFGAAFEHDQGKDGKLTLLAVKPKSKTVRQQRPKHSAQLVRPGAGRSGDDIVAIGAGVLHGPVRPDDLVYLDSEGYPHKLA